MQKNGRADPPVGRAEVLPAGLSAAGGGVTMTGANYPHAAIPETYAGGVNWYKEAASRLAEDSQGELVLDDGAHGGEMDDEEEADDDEGVRKLFTNLYKAVCGSVTVLLMNLALGVVILVRCCVSSNAPEGAANCWKIGSVMYGTALMLSAVILLLRFVWTKLIVKPFFPDRRTLNLLTWFLDPEFGTLLWTVACLLLYTGALTRRAEDAPESAAYRFYDFGTVSAADYKAYYYTMIFLALWASRDVLVKAIMLNLMLGFLMNFNNEVVQFLHRYSQIRRLNAAWVKLVPSTDLSSLSAAPLDDAAVATGGAVATTGDALVTLASIGDADTPAQRARRQREYSKQRLRAIAHLNRSLSKQQLPSRMGSKLADFNISESLVGDLSHTALEVEGSRASAAQVAGLPAGDNSKLEFEETTGATRGSKWNFEFTSRQKKRREREYHVDYTGRALPRLLEVKSILDTQKSQLSNLLAINWLREQPVVIFVDGQRCELESKAHAKYYGQLLFQTLLEFRQTLIDVEEEEKAIIGQTDCDPQAASAQAIQNLAKRLSSVSLLSAPGSAGGGVPPPAARRLSSKHSLQASSLNLTKSAGGVAQQYRDSHSEHDSSPAVSSPSSSSASDDGMLLVERSITHNQIFAPEDAQSLPSESPSGGDKAGGRKPDVREVDVRTSADRLFEDTSAAFHGAEPPGQRHWIRRRGERGTQREDLTTLSSRWLTEPSPKSGGVKSWYQRSPMTDAQLAEITADEIRKVKLQMPDDRDCLTEDFFELFMSTTDAKQLCAFLDPGHLGKITAKMFTKGIIQTYKIRKQIVHSLEAQEEIESVFTRVCEYLVTFLCLLIFLLILGIDPNTIIVTGVSVLTAAGLVLSFVYTDFVQSIILLVFLNPYRIGDRVRLDGEAQYVKRITTYFTEFESLNGKPQYISHKELVSKVIINESRCKNASSEIQIFFSERTTPSQYAAFKKVLEAYLKSRPQEFIGDSLFVYIMGVAPSHYIQLSIWVTHTEGWGNWMFIRTSESSLMHFIMRQAQILGMYYKLPVQRWEQYAPPARQSPPANTYRPPTPGREILTRLPDQE